MSRQLWSLGDYPAVAEVIGDLGTDLVAAAAIQPGSRVLDVAAGTGNATLPAARCGARVTACDIVSSLLAVGAHAAHAEGLPIRWVVADAQSLPFADDEFDVVLSCVGAMFAPDQRATANELVRVCRPGGRVAMATWTPGGSVGRFFGVFGPYTEPVDSSPLAWGDPDHVRRLFGPGCTVQTRESSIVARFTGSPEEFVSFYKQRYAPVIATYAGLDGDPDRTAALDADFLAFARAENTARAGGPGHYVYDYLQIVATKR